MKKMTICIALLLCSANYANAVQLVFYIPSGATTENSRMYNNLIENFKRENAEIQVKFKPMTNYNKVLNEVLRLTKQAKGGWVAVVEVSELLTLKDYGAIMPFEKLIDLEPGGKETFLTKFFPGFLGNSYGDDEKIYGLPFYRSTPITYYNLDVLRGAGVETSKLPETWDEFEDMLEKVRKKTGQPPFHLAATWYGWLFESLVRQNGGALANKNNTQVFFDSPETIGALEFLKRLQDKGLMLRIKGSWKACINGFVNGKFPVIYYSTGGMSFADSDSKFTWTTTLMPKNKFFAAGIGGGNIFASSIMSVEQEKAAWKLVKFFMKPDIQATISAQSGYFPVVPDAFEDSRLKYRYTKQEAFKQARHQLDFANAKIMTRNYKEVRIILKQAIDATLNNNVPAEQSLKTAQQEAQRWIKLKVRRS